MDYRSHKWPLRHIAAMALLLAGLAAAVWLDCRIAALALCGLLARAVVVISPEGQIVYTQLVPEITEEPDYEAALAAIK